jgi:adenylate cyclase
MVKFKHYQSCNNPEAIPMFNTLKMHRQKHGSSNDASPAKHRNLSVFRFLMPSQLPIAIKLAAAIGVLLTVAMLLLGALIVNHQKGFLESQLRATGQTVTHQLAGAVREHLLADDVLQMEILAHNLKGSENIIGTSIYSAEYKTLAASGHNPFDAYGPFEGKAKHYMGNATNMLKWHWPYSPAGHLKAIAYLSPVKFKDLIVGYVVVSFSMDAIENSIDKVVHTIAGITLALIFLGIIISYVLGKRLTRPIQHLIDASRAIDKGQYDIKLPSERGDEIGYLMNSLNSMARGMLEKKQVEAAFKRHVSPNIADEILSNIDEVQLGGTHVYSTVMFVDIVGFTSTSESLSPDAVARMLNEFYSYINHSIHLYKGTIDKFIGDCVMMVFGVPDTDRDHVFHAIAYAVFIQRLADRLNKIRISKGLPPVHYRIGINSGEMLAGNIGSSSRMQYTVVGDSVNLASRLASIANTNEIMISEKTYQTPHLKERIVAVPNQSLHIRGKKDPINTYLVHDVTGAEQNKMEKMIDTIINSITKENL